MNLFWIFKESALFDSVCTRSFALPGSAECPGGDDGVPGSCDERRNRQV